MKRILTVLTLAVVMLALPMSTIYASEPKDVSGTQKMNLPSPDSFCEQRGNSDNFICTEYLTESWDGDIKGVSSEFESRWETHDMVPYVVPTPDSDYMCISPDIDGWCWGLPVTWCTGHDTRTFETASVKVGDVTYTVSGLSIQLNLQHKKGGNWVIKSGTIDLDGKTMNIHGSGTLSPDGSYSGKVHVGP